MNVTTYTRGDKVGLKLRVMDFAFKENTEKYLISLEFNNTIEKLQKKAKAVNCEFF